MAAEPRLALRGRAVAATGGWRRWGRCLTLRGGDTAPAVDRATAGWSRGRVAAHMRRHVVVTKRPDVCDDQCSPVDHPELAR
jgi:hypothetical protein